MVPNHSDKHGSRERGHEPNVLVDRGPRVATRVEKFDGKLEGRQCFRLQLVIALSNIGMHDHMDQAARFDVREEDARHSNLDDDQKVMAESLYALLAEKCEG